MTDRPMIAAPRAARPTDRPAPPRWRRNLLRAAVLAWSLGPLTCSGIHDDELRCEEAVAHLASCCPTFRPEAIDCRYSAGCGSVTNRPELLLEQSGCILDRSCDALKQGAAGSTCSRSETLPREAMTNKLLLCP